MPSFSERFHEHTKYNPETIAKTGGATPRTEGLFRSGKDPLALEIHPCLSYLADSKPLSHSNWLSSPSSARQDPSGFVASLAYFSVGITHILRSADEHFYFRANPSAGGLYPTELYVALRNHPHFADGLYYFHPLELSFWPIMSFDPWPLLQNCFFDGDCLEDAQVLLLYTARAPKAVWRYKDRAYRRMHLDTGHALGNSTAFLDYHGHPYQILSGFNDAKLAQRMGLDLLEEPVLCALATRWDGQELRPAHFYRSPNPSLAVKQTDLSLAIYQNQILVEQCTDAEIVLPQLQSAKAGDISLELEPELEYQTPLNIRMRRSCRQFQADTLELDQFSACLAYACQDIQKLPGSELLEHYLVLRRVSGIEPGIYRFDPITHSMEKVQDFVSWEPFAMALLNQDIGMECSALWIFASKLSLLTEQYGDRGYRYQGLCAGLLGERLNLAGVEHGIGISGLGGYFDDLLNDLLGLDRTKAILYGSCMGLENESLD